MSRLNSVKPSEATGHIAQTYQYFNEFFGKVPNIFQFHTASEDIYGIMTQYFQFLSEHKTLSKEFFSYLRLYVSNREKGQYCINFNTAVLQHLGHDAEVLKQAAVDISHANLPKKEIELLKLAIKVSFNANEVSEEDIDAVRKLGYSDKEIYEASYAAIIQMAMAQMVKAFKVIPDFPNP